MPSPGLRLYPLYRWCLLANRGWRWKAHSCPETSGDPYYIKPLTKLIVDYIANEGYDVLDYVALEIPHNLDVARHDQNELPGIMQGMKIANADVLVLSA